MSLFENQPLFESTIDYHQYASMMTDLFGLFIITFRVYNPSYLSVFSSNSHEKNPTNQINNKKHTELL